MAHIVKNIAELVGHTPLFEFVRLEEKYGLKAYGADVMFTSQVPRIKEAKEAGIFSMAFYQKAIEEYCAAQETKHFL